MTGGAVVVDVVGRFSVWFGIDRGGCGRGDFSTVDGCGIESSWWLLLLCLFYIQIERDSPRSGDDVRHPIHKMSVSANIQRKN